MSVLSRWRSRQAHVVGHVERAEARRVAGAEIAVDVVLGEAGILQRAVGDLGMELRDGLGPRPCASGAR